MFEYVAYYCKKVMLQDSILPHSVSSGTNAIKVQENTSINVIREGWEGKLYHILYGHRRLTSSYDVLTNILFQSSDTPLSVTKTKVMP